MPTLPPEAPSTPPVRERILDVARGLFFRHGVHAVTTDLLARECRISKSTLYRHFPDMAGLFLAVIEREADQIASNTVSEPATPAQFWTSLKRYGANLLHLLNRAEVIRLDRLVHEQARWHPGLGRRFFDATYGRSLREVEAMLAFGAARGFIRGSVSPREDAEMLLSLWESLAFGRARLGLVEQPFADPEAWAARCVDRFFPGHVW